MRLLGHKRVIDLSTLFFFAHCSCCCLPANEYFIDVVNYRECIRRSIERVSTRGNPPTGSAAVIRFIGMQFHMHVHSGESSSGVTTLGVFFRGHNPLWPSDYPVINAKANNSSRNFNLLCRNTHCGFKANRRSSACRMKKRASLSSPST